MKKILIIDDSQDSRAIIREMLEGCFQTFEASNGREGILLAVREQPALILLDINMPEMTGFEVCKRLMEQPATRAIPVIIVSSEADMDSRVLGLNLGADDYITKPFNSRDLLARVQARLRRKTLDETEKATLEVANLKLDPKEVEAYVDQKPIGLTAVEFDLLRYLVERKGETIDRNRLLGDLWPDAVVTPRTVDTHVGNLRRKLKGARCEIKAVYGAGYLFKQTD